MQLFKSNDESFERKFGKVVYPKREVSGGMLVRLFLLFSLLSAYFGSNGEIHIGVVLSGVVFIFFLPSLKRSYPYYITLQGIYLKSDSFTNKAVFASWEDIIKIELNEGYRFILIHHKDGNKYRYQRRGRGRLILKPFMDCLKKVRPDIEVSYIQFGFKEMAKMTQEGVKAQPWVVIFGAIIIILILVVSADI